MQALTETAEKYVDFHMPSKPYSVIDGINRWAAGQGSVGYAQASADSDYNGHSLGMWWNDYRGYYIAEYYWGERVVIARGNAQQVLDAAIHEFKNHQGRGASFSVRLKESDAHLAIERGLLEGKEQSPPAWWTPLHSKVGEAGMWERQHMAPAFAFLANSKTVEEYDGKVKEYFTKMRDARATAKN